MGGGGGAVIPAENIGVSWSVGRYQEGGLKPKTYRVLV